MIKLVGNNSLEKERILKLCKEVVSPNEIFASCFYGPGIYGYGDEESDINVMLVISRYPPKISTFSKQMNGVNLSILAIDKKVFESDVGHGEFGELVAEIITQPFQPWMKPKYLEKMELRMKKRFVLELLKNVILQYPELSMELLINPDYFMYEVMRRRARLFPPIMHNLVRVFRGKARKKNIDFIMKGYRKALRRLERENFVALSDGYVKINKKFIESTKVQSRKFSTIFNSIQKTLLSYIKGISSKILTAFLHGQMPLAENSLQKDEVELLKQLEETEKYLLMPTPLGPVPLSDKTDIKDFVLKTVPSRTVLKISIEEMGGVLNSIFLLHIKKNNTTKRVVVKKFEDWLGLKWFPLALWTLGTKSFAVLSTTRLKREYSINQFLRNKGFVVPRILYVSLKRRLIFEDFVEGEKISEIVKNIIISSPNENMGNSVEIIEKVGEELAKVHALDIALGDCKPENMLVTNDERICFLDLEQATRNGNQPWDIAEFLYYSGHYILPTHSDKAAKKIASSFIEGYLRAGGKRENIKKAASAKYTKVFSIFTLPNIILSMASICRKMAEDDRNKQVARMKLDAPKDQLIFT